MVLLLCAVCLCYACIVGMGLHFHAVLCSLCGSSVVGVAGVVGRPWVCFAVVWWVGHSPLLCCVLLLILNLNIFLVHFTFSQHEW